jgi:Lon protease-like protein
VKFLDGRPVPLFPLPSVVLYPRIVQPLHIFEPRYRQMLADVLDSHGKIAMALLKPGFEPEYHDSPEIHPVVAVGNLVTYHMREDGTSDIVLLGECRARVVEEADGKLYRRASLVRLRERQPHAIQQREELRGRLKRWLRYAVDEFEGKQESLARLQKSFAKESDIGFLVDFLAYHFLKESASQQKMLEELDVKRRAESLLEKLGDL